MKACRQVAWEVVGWVERHTVLNELTRLAAQNTSPLNDSPKECMTGTLAAGPVHACTPSLMVMLRSVLYNLSSNMAQDIARQSVRW